MAQFVRTLAARRSFRIAFWIVVLAALGALYFWLLPVSIQSRLSADHVRRVFGISDLAPVAGNSLSSLWVVLLEAMKLTGLGVGTETYPTAAAFSAWIVLASIAVLATYVAWPIVIAVVLLPPVLWTAVVPNGISLSLLALACVGYFSRPLRTFDISDRARLMAQLLEGIACALTPAAWILVIVKAVRLRKTSLISSRIIRAVLFLIGLSLPFSIGIVIDALQGQTVSSFAAFPAARLLRELSFDDPLGAAAVMMGSGGELAIGLLAALAFTVAILLSPGWRSEENTLPNRIAIFGKWAFLVAPFVALVTIGHLDAWRMMHPGWNTVLEDFAQSVERGFSKPVVAFVSSATEESALRYVDQIQSKKQNLVALRALNLFEPSTKARVLAREPGFSFSEAENAVSGGASGAMASQQTFAAFVDFVIVPNLKRGIQFWLEVLPDRNEGLEISFLGNGMRIRQTEGPTKFQVEREALRATYIRARMSAREYAAGSSSVEARVFERYSVFHMAMAHILEREKKTPDWKQRARGEYYAALRKVEWLKEPYQKVCVETGEESSISPSIGTTSPEVLDACKETAWYHEASR